MRDAEFVFSIHVVGGWTYRKKEGGTIDDEIPNFWSFRDARVYFFACLLCRLPDTGKSYLLSEQQIGANI